MSRRRRHLVGGLALGAIGVAFVLVFLYRQLLLEWVYLGEQRRILGAWRTPGWDMAGHSPIEDGSYNCWIFASELTGVLGIRFKAKRYFISMQQTAVPKQEFGLVVEEGQIKLAVSDDESEGSLRTYGFRFEPADDILVISAPPGRVLPREFLFRPGDVLDKELIRNASEEIEPGER